MPELNWEIFESGYDHQMVRLMVPGGWLVRLQVLVFDNRVHKLDYRSVTFVPDHNHEWGL